MGEFIEVRMLDLGEDDGERCEWLRYVRLGAIDMVDQHMGFDMETKRSFISEDRCNVRFIGSRHWDVVMVGYEEMKKLIEGESDWGEDAGGEVYPSSPEADEEEVRGSGETDTVLDGGSYFCTDCGKSNLLKIYRTYRYHSEGDWYCPDCVPEEVRKEAEGE